MATIMASIANTIEQKIEPTIYESAWKLDPLFPMIKRSYMNVQRSNIGQGWIVLKTWEIGVAGGAYFNTAQGGNTLSGSNQFTAYDTAQAFPGLGDTAYPTFPQTQLTLLEHRGNFYLPHQLLRSDQLSASVGSTVSVHIKAVAKLLNQQEAAMLYSADPTASHLATIDDTSGAAANASGDTAAVVFSIDSATTTAGGTSGSPECTGRIHRFRPGMLVDIYSEDKVTKRNDSFLLYVDTVDPVAQTFELRRLDGGTFQVDTVLDGSANSSGTVALNSTGMDLDVIVIKTPKSTSAANQGPNGLNSWIADGTAVTSFFNITVSEQPQFKSILTDLTVSTNKVPLTEGILNREYTRFYQAFTGQILDSAITTDGVLTGFVDNLDANLDGGGSSSTYRYDRNGKELEVQAGYSMFKYRLAGRPVEIYTSTYCEHGHWYSGKLKNGGIQRYIPPPIPGASTDSRFGNEFQFIGALGGSAGYQGIFKHAHNSSGNTTDFVEAPFLRIFNLMPEQPNWLKIHNIAEIPVD